MARDCDDHGSVFSMEAQVRWADIDRLGHANNLAYWRWCEDARNLQAVAVGLGMPSPERPSQILVSASADYLAPVALHDIVIVERRVLEIGRASQKANYKITCKDVVVFTANCTVVLFDFAKGASHPYPDEVRRRLLGDA